MDKIEYEMKLADIEKLFEPNKEIRGLQIRQMFIRTDEEGNSFIIFKTHSSKMPIVSIPVTIGMPESVVKFDAKNAFKKQDQAKARLQEQLIQEEAQKGVKKRQQEAIQAQAEKMAQIQEEEAKKAKSRLKKLFGG